MMKNRHCKLAIYMKITFIGVRLKDFTSMFVGYVFSTLYCTVLQTETVLYGKSLISVSQEFFASINKMLILAGGLCTRLSFYEV